MRMALSGFFQGPASVFAQLRAASSNVP